MEPVTKASLPATLSDLLSERAKRSDTRVADRSRSWTWPELADRAGRAATALEDRGVRPGDRVALWMDNSLEWLETWFAVARVGATLVPINTRLSPREAQYVLKQGDCRWLVADARICAKGPPEWATSAHLADVFPVGVEQPGHALSDLARQPSIAMESADQNGMVQYTSGSTAFPKGAVLVNRALIRNAAGLARAWKVTPTDRILCANPLFHCGGSVFAFLVAATVGCSVYLSPRWDVQVAASDIRVQEITVFPGIDAMVRDLVGFADLYDYSFPSLRLVSTAANRQLFEQVVRVLRCEISNVYGLTEASPNVAVGDLDDDLETRLAYVGRPQRGTTVEIRDPGTGKALAPGAVGAIAVRSWSVMRGYFNDATSTTAAFDDQGFLLTGDLGRLTRDGYLEYCGRVKQMIKSGGENVSIEEVEDCLRHFPGVLDAVVVPVPHERFGEVGFAFLQVARGDIDVDKVKDHCRQSLAGFKIPKYFEVIDWLPRTGSGKVDRQTLRGTARLRQQRPQPRTGS